MSNRSAQTHLRNAVSVVLCACTMIPLLRFTSSLSQADETTNFLTLSFPEAISIQAPKNWHFLDEHLKATLRTVGEAAVKVAELEYPVGVETTLVAANGYLTGELPGAMMRLTVVKGSTGTQQETRVLTDEDLRSLALEAKRGLELLFKKSEIDQGLEWIGTRVTEDNGYAVLVHEYFRTRPDGDRMLVQMNLIDLGDRQIKLTLSRLEKERLWIPVLKHIRSSLTIGP